MQFTPSHDLAEVATDLFFLSLFKYCDTSKVKWITEIDKMQDRTSFHPSVVVDWMETDLNKILQTIGRKGVYVDKKVDVVLLKDQFTSRMNTS